MKLAEIRRARGMTQMQLANAASVEQSTISRLERNEGRVDLDLLQRIADILGAKVADFFADDRRDGEQFLLDAFRALPDARQQGWLDMARAVQAEQEGRTDA